MSRVEDVPFDVDPPKPAAKRPGKGTMIEATPKPEVDAGAELADLVTDKPAEILLNEKSRHELYQKLTKEIEAFVPDLSTGAGRDRVKSLHYKLVRTRTALDSAGKDHTADLRLKIDKVNEVRSVMRERMGELEDLARLPLTRWEKAEADRVAATKAARDYVDGEGRIQDWHNSDLLAERIEGLKTWERPACIADDDWTEIDAARTETIEALSVALVKAIDAEDQAAENERLRAENDRLTKAAAAAAAVSSPAAEPVIEHHELPPRINSEAQPAAATAPAPLSPVRIARRAALTAMMTLPASLSDDYAKALILAIEGGKIPGITATYLEN